MNLNGTKTEHDSLCFQRAFKKAKAHRISLPLQHNQEQPVPTEIHSAAPPFCIHTKLRELHLEECERDPNFSTTVRRISAL